MSYFEELKQACDENSKIAQEYLSSLPFINNSIVIEKIWNWAVSKMEVHENGYFIFSGKNELAENIIDSGVPFSEIPRNGSLHYALGWSVTAQEANLRSLLEFIEGRQTEWIKFKCLAEIEDKTN